DGGYGLGGARGRLGRRREAVLALRRAVALAPDYIDAVDQLLAWGVDSGLAPPPVAPSAEPQVAARTQREHFEVRTAQGWEPFYVKGINLGAALPGKFPSQFPPDDSTYARWLELIAAANANTVRLYTILPPAFYRALARWNEGHPDHALWLVHGVWAELPPGGNYDAPGWKADFRREMRRAVDVVHGRALVGARAGHAWGRYDADVSDHVLAFVLGREWEPFSIRAYNRRPHGRRAYQGRFLAVERGTPADVWLAEQCDELLRYEWDVYRAQRPIAYTNWPPLDPLRHSTESSRAEEQALRRRYGFPPNPRLMEYDNDVDALDAMLVRTTAADLGGYFAAYHAYPYYPDFIDLDAGYGAATSAEGPSHYFGYLLDLQRHHAGRPVLVAEYGVPGEYAGAADATPEPGGDTARWRALPLLDRNDSIALRVGADPAYLYLVLEGGPELDVSRYVVGIDTHRGAGGERRLPGVAGASDVGFEFALVLNDTTDAQLLVVPAYNPYLVPRAGAGPTALDAFYHWGATLEGASAGGAWDSLFVTTNRWRDGRTYAARGVNRGRLRYGRAAASSLADWYVDRDAGLVEVRLAWGLLNVTDPSSRRVLRRIALPDRFETTVSEGLRFTVAAVARDDGAVRAWLPGATFAWAPWEEPVWHERLKPAYAALRDVWGSW